MPPSPREVPRRGGGSNSLSLAYARQLPHRGRQGGCGSSCPPCARVSHASCAAARCAVRAWRTKELPLSAAICVRHEEKVLLAKEFRRSGARALRAKYRRRHFSLVPPRGGAAKPRRWEFSPPSPREVPRRGGGSNSLSLAHARQLPLRGSQGRGAFACKHL